MSAKPMHRGHLLLIAVGILAILIKLAASVDLDGQDVVRFAQQGNGSSRAEKPEAEEPAPAVVPEQGTALERLSCFGCHELSAYLEGDDFPHVEHEQLHCHVCHAFQGHAEAFVREDSCEACH